MDDSRDTCACDYVKGKSAKVSGRGDILNAILAGSYWLTATIFPVSWLGRAFA